MSEIFCNFASVSVNSMKKIVYVALLCSLLSVFTGCDTGSSPSHVDARRAALSVMAKADSLMRTRPDSALKLLYSLTPEGKPFPLGEGWGEAYYLLLLDAQNKCDTVFRSDTLQRALVSYYDRHGTPNERMRAYYLLGRACHDMGEVPKALDSYLTAISVADTTSADCDYYHLCRVYGQMAEIFRLQLLAEDMMEATKASERYAWLAKDTLQALVAFEFRTKAYYFANKKDSALYIAETARKKYINNGYTHKAVWNLSFPINIYLDRNQYDKAGQYLTEFEQESGVFDKNGNIKKGWEMFYYLKGRYLSGIGKSDSAMACFRRVLSAGMNEAAYKGLLSVYEKKRNTDSIAKYARLYVDANDSAFLQKNSEAVHRISALYKYERSQRAAAKAEKELAELSKQKIVSWIIYIIVILLLTSLAIYKYERLKTASLRRINMLTRSYANLMEELENSKSAMQQLNDRKLSEETLQAQINDYNKKIKNQCHEISELKKQISSNTKKDLERAFYQTDLYKYFCEKKKPTVNIQAPTSKDWDALVNSFQIYFHDYLAFLTENWVLTDDQLHVCLLLRLNFQESDIATVLNADSDRVCRIKRQVNHKIFGFDTAKMLKKHLKNHF